MYNITNRRAGLTAKCSENNGNNNNKKIFFLPVRVLPGSFLVFFQTLMIHLWMRPPILSCFSFIYLFFPGCHWAHYHTGWLLCGLHCFFCFFPNLVRSPNDPPTSPWWMRRENCDITATWNQRRAMLKPRRCRSETKGSVESSCCTHQNPRFPYIVYLCPFYFLVLIRTAEKRKRGSISAASGSPSSTLAVKSQTPKKKFILERIWNLQLLS